MASLAGQDLAALGGPASVLARQKRDHIRLDGLLDQLGMVPPDAQAPLLVEIYRLVFPHAFAEEAVLWPALRRTLPEGYELTLRVEIEHQEINELVARLEALEPGSAERRGVLDQIVALLREDVRDEEDVLLPRLQQAITPRQLRLLGFAWEAVRRIAPTRAHPIVARRPPGNILSALPLSFLDRCRDRIDAARFRGGAPAPRLEALSTGLARAADAVERLPGMRRGEDPATRRAARRRPGAAVLAGVAAVAGVATLLALAARRYSRSA